MRWTASPERREIALILFSIAAYFFAYNLEESLHLFGIDPVATQGAVFSRLGLGKTKIIGRDGRKPAGWRDKLETDIFGSWAWDEGHVAGDGEERSQRKGTGRHGAQWIGREAVGEVNGKRFGETTADQALTRWMDEVPLVNIVKHAPGYTIMDNVIIFNGTVYLVTNDKASLPNMKSMVETVGKGFKRWQILTKKEGQEKLGNHGSFIRGVSWLSADPQAHNSTLFDLWRLYSTLDPSIDSAGHTVLPAPDRLIFPHNRVFTDANPPFGDHWIRRHRVDTGFHPYLAKAAFPRLTMLYLEDWEDYHKMAVPFVFERLVIADRKAASSAVTDGQPVNSPPYGLETSKWWWEPVRRTLARYFDKEEAGKREKKTVTYLDRQSEAGEDGGSMLVPDDHEMLVRALKKMGRDRGYEVHVVSTDPNETPWDEKMDVIVKSTVVLGVHGNHLFDSVWMRPSSKTTLMEIFPENTFSSDRELAVRSIEVDYVAWQGSQQFTGQALPKPRVEETKLVHVDADAVVQAIHAILSKPEPESK